MSQDHDQHFEIFKETERELVRMSTLKNIEPKRVSMFKTALIKKVTNAINNFPETIVLADVPDV